MMNEARGRSFVGLRDQGGARIVDLDLVGCRFESCVLSATRVVRSRTLVRSVKLEQCEQQGCYVGAAVFEDVVVDGLRSSEVLQVWGAVFRHVVLKGRLDRLMLSPTVAPSTANWAEQRAFDDAAAAFYAETDWALDISEADFKGADIRGVPADLIRRDPETQAVVRRANVADERWRSIDLSKTYWDVTIELMLKEGREDVVLVVPKRAGKKRADLIDGIKRLRDAGVADHA